ncbi:MAG: hypothetical protein QNL12_03090 [Acidimicrobiia bacterium]|nr:hypothetical protein [Acidimicrobiia bacterium]
MAVQSPAPIVVPTGTRESYDKDDLTTEVEAISAVSAAKFSPNDMSGPVDTPLGEVVSIYNDATGGTFTLTFGAQTTAAIDFDATAAEVKAALELLSTITEVTVTGTGVEATPWAVVFVEPFGDVGAVTATDTSLTGETDGTTIAAVAGDVALVQPHMGLSGAVAVIDDSDLADLTVANKTKAAMGYGANVDNHPDESIVNNWPTDD